jgi:hypothetical protein
MRFFKGLIKLWTKGCRRMNDREYDCPGHCPGPTAEGCGIHKPERCPFTPEPEPKVIIGPRPDGTRGPIQDPAEDVPTAVRRVEITPAPDPAPAAAQPSALPTDLIEGWELDPLIRPLTKGGPRPGVGGMKVDRVIFDELTSGHTEADPPPEIVRPAGETPIGPRVSLASFVDTLERTTSARLGYAANLRAIAADCPVPSLADAIRDAADEVEGRPTPSRGGHHAG